MSKYSNDESILLDNGKDLWSIAICDKYKYLIDVLKDVGTFLLLDPVKNHRKSDTLELSPWWQQNHLILEKVSWKHVQT